MHSQKRKSKKPNKKTNPKRSEYSHYQPNNPLTIYFAKLIERKKSK